MALECVQLIVFFRILICTLLDVKNMRPNGLEFDYLPLQLKVIDVRFSSLPRMEQVAAAS